MKKVELPVENILYKVCFSSSFFPFSFFPLLSPFFSISISISRAFLLFFPLRYLLDPASVAVGQRTGTFRWFRLRDRKKSMA